MHSYTKVKLFTYLIFLLSTSAQAIDLSLFKVTKVNDSLYVMQQDYGAPSINFAAVVGSDSIVLITTMMREYNPHVEALIQSFTDKPIKYVVSIDGDTYQYHGSRYFVAKGATFIAHKNLIPDVFKNRVLVDSPYSLDVGTEQILAIPTKAHTLDHMMVKLNNSNTFFAGDALSFDWIVYSGANGPEAHLDSLKQILKLSDDETRFYPGNWISKQYGTKKDVEAFINTYGKFVKLVKELNSQGLSPSQIAQNTDVLSVLKPLKDYQRQSPYIVHYVSDVLGVES